MFISIRDLPFLGFVAAALAVRALPASRRVQGMRSCAAVLGGWWYRLHRSDAALTRRNLDLVFGNRRPEEQIAATTRAVYRQVAQRVLVQDIVANLGPAQISDLASLEGREHLDAALASGRGVVLLGSHFGLSGYLWLKLLEQHGYPVTAVLGEELEPGSSWVYSHIVYPVRRRARGQFKIVRPGAMPQRDMLDVLKQNRILLTTGDALDDETFHLSAPNVLPICFSGQKLPLKTGPFRLAGWWKAPLVPFFMAPRPDGGFKLIIEPALPVSSDHSRAGMQANLAAYWARFEPYLLRYPELWAHWRHERLPELMNLAGGLAASA